MTWLRGLLIVALLFPCMARAENQTVGTTAAVNPDATGTPPGGDSRTLLVGANVVFKEKIKTVGKGQTQILFLDQSTVTVAPNSDLVLDEFVYDPNASTGKLTISMGTGLLRYVGGVISHNSGVTINTPTATLTVRGGMVLVQSDATGTSVIPILGTTIVQPLTGGGAPATPQSGTVTTVSNNGQVSNTPASGEQIQGFYTQLQGPSNPSPGGNVTVVSVDQQLGDQGMAGGSQPAPESSGGTQTGSDTSGGTGSGASSADTGGTSPGAPPSSVQNSITNTTQSSTTQPGSTVPGTAGPFDGRYMSTPGPYTTTFGDFFDDPVSENAVGGPIGTDNNQGFSGATVANGRLTISLNGSLTVDLPIQSGTFTVTGSTNTPIGQVTGNGFYDPNLGFFAYQLTGPGGAPDEITLFGGTPTPSNGLLPGGSQVSFESWDILDSQTVVPFLPSSIAAQFPNATISPIAAVFQAGGTIGDVDINGSTRSHWLWASLDIAGQGDSQQSMLVGTSGGFYSDGGFLYVDQGTRGMINMGNGSPLLWTSADVGSAPSAGATQTSSSNEFFGPNLNYFVLQNNDTGGGNGAYETDSGFVGSQDGSTSLLYGFTALASQTSTPASTGTNRSSRTLNGYFANLGQSYIVGTGYLTPYAITNANGLPTDLTLQTDTNTNTIQAAFDFANVTQDLFPTSLNVTSGSLTFGGVGYGRSAYIDDQHMGALNAKNPALAGNINGDLGIVSPSSSVDGFRSFMVSHDVVGTSGLLPNGVSLCTCQYLEWGYWVSQFQWDNNSGDPNNDGRTEFFNIGTWVAGDLTSVAQVQGLTGSATFGGHVIANVFNGNSQYLAAGSFSSNWNFASATGTVAINSLDNLNYTGSIATGAGAANNFSGTISSGTIAGNLSGSFFNAPGVPAKYMAGSVTAQDTQSLYRLSGTFAAQQ